MKDMTTGQKLAALAHIGALVFIGIAIGFGAAGFSI